MKNTTSLFREGKTALERGDSFAALESFLTLREQHLDLAQVLGTEEVWIDKSDLFDVDRNGSEDLVVLVRNQGILVFSLTDSFPDGKLPLPGNGFTLYRGSEGKILSVVGGKQGDTPCRLRIYHIERESNEELRFSPIAEPEIDDVQIHDIAYKRNRIYVAASNGFIYQYDGLTHQRQEEKSRMDSPIVRFYTNTRFRQDTDREQLDMGLLAITEQGELTRFTLGPPLEEQALRCSVGSLCDLFVADLDNDGASNIVACTRNGRVIVLDWDTLDVRYEYTAFDVFHCVFCEDIDGDGHTEILVGARSGKLYVLGLDDNRKLYVKWIEQIGHEVLAIQAGNDPLKIILALGNGQIRLYDVYCQGTLERRLNAEIREASRQSIELSAPELGHRIARTGTDAVIEFALDNDTRRMECDQLVTFLQAITKDRSPTDCGVILQKLPGFLDKCHGSSEMMVFASDLLARIANSASDWTLYERLSDSVNRIALASAGNLGNRIAEFVRDFRSELMARTSVEKDKISRVKNLIEHGELELAREELQELTRQGLDLLRIHKSPTGVRRLYCTRQGKALVAIGQDNTLTIFDTFGRNDPVGPVATPNIPVAYARLPGRQQHPPHVVFSGRNSVGFTDDLASHQEICRHEDEIRCAVFLEWKDSDIRVVGLRNGLLLFREFDAKGVHIEELPKEWKLDTFPVAMVARKDANVFDLYVFTVTGDIFLFQSVGQNESSLTEPTSIGSLPRPINILDVVCLEDENGQPNLIVLHSDGLIILHEDSERGWIHEEIFIAGGLTCMCPVTLEDATPQLMIGTAERGLVFYGLNGSTRKLPLPYVPTALVAADDPREGTEILVGFDRGDIYRYRIIGEQDLVVLRGQCDAQAQARYEKRRTQYEGQWNRCNTYEKLALTVLATCESCEHGEIRRHLDAKVVTLLRHGVIREAVRVLEGRGIISGSVREGHVAYRITDLLYKKWIAETKDQFSVVREEREALRLDLDLPRFSLIDEELRSTDSLEWIFEFVFRDHKKWRRLVEVSRLFDTCCRASTKEAIASAGLAYLSSIMRSIPATVSNRKNTGVDSMATYKVTVPEIRFIGFDKILAVVIRDVAGDTPGMIKRCWEDMGRPRLVLVLTPDRCEFLSSCFRNETFYAVILDSDQIKGVFLTDEPGRDLLDRMVSQIELAALSPFQTAGPVSDMFYGRKEELTSLLASLERPGWKNYAVVGPRRVGKTSLLHKVRTELEEKKAWKAIYIDASSFGTITDPTERIHTFFQVLLDRLEITGTPQGFIEAVGTAYRAGKSRLAIFVDEVDDLLKAHAHHAEDLFPRTIRTLINQFDIKVMLAGYKTLYFQMHDEQSALFNMLDRLDLAALDEESAEALIRDPLDNVIEISRDTIHLICEKTGRFPNFIQICCRLLLERARVQQSRRITQEDVLEVTRSRAFFEYIVGVYVQNLQELSKLIFYLLLSYYDTKTQRFIWDARVPAAKPQRKSLIHEEIRFTAYDIHGIVEKYDVTLTTNELQSVMDELVLACVLIPTEGTRYRFVLPDLPELMRSHEEILETTVNMLEEAREDFLHYRSPPNIES
uniref:ATPase n=1 Tax=Candidatus Kentrum sp. LFY TaxID=2126342 RepID=A0A450UFV1_9GAMM|nr:MAG: ATPase [Candidatus Kentron sp. LFY]